jgi:hypothetical protein
MTNRGKPSRVVGVGQLPNTVEVERELEWVFALAEGEMGNRSNYERSLSTVDPECTARTAEDRVEAARRHSKILGRLRAMPSREAGVLQAAYEPAGWPVRLRDELGVLTGIVVRLVCAEVGLPEEREAMKGLEQSVAKRLADEQATRGLEPIQRLRVQAQELLSAAHRAYAEVRAKEQTAMETAPRKNAPTSDVEKLPVRSVYKLSELARAAGVTRWRMVRILESLDIDLYRPGSVGLIPVHELETKAKLLWDAIRCAERIRQDARDPATRSRDAKGARD